MEAAVPPSFRRPFNPTAACGRQGYGVTPNYVVLPFNLHMDAPSVLLWQPKAGSVLFWPISPPTLARQTLFTRMAHVLFDE